MDNWISVKDRLPENKEYVLCCTAGFIPYVAIYNAFDNKKWTQYGDSVNPSHWMPLPEPPK